MTSIGEHAFYNCPSLTSVTIPNSVTNIGYSVFYGCSGLTSVTIPNSVTSIGDYAFYNCSSLTSITIPNSVTSIGWYAFSRCSGLTSVTIPNSVTSIGWYAFSECSSLTSVTILNSVTSIGSGTFNGCSALKSITVRNVFCINEGVFDNDTYKRATLYVPTGWKFFFQEDEVWGKFSSIVEVDMPDVKIEDNPFELLNSKRLIIGYTNGDKNNFQPYTSRGTGDYAQAIKFPKERMTRIKGNQITHIRFNSNLTTESFSDMGYTDMKIWIGSSRDQRDLFCQDITDLCEGWNNIALEHPYTITGDSILVGVSFHKNKEESNAFPVRGEINVHDDENLLRFDNGRWREGWSENYGAWHIQCMVEGDNIPKFDAQIVYWGGLPWHPLYKRAIKAGEEFDCCLKLRNWGSMSFKASDMLALLGGEEVECSWGNHIISRGSGVHDRIYFHVTPSKNTKVGNHKLTLKPKAQNGEEYQEAFNEISLKVYEHDMGRQKVLVQVYAGQGCSFCPEFYEQVEKKEKERDDLVTININGYWWQGMSTSEASKIYDNVFSCGFVPSIDLNRCFDKQTFDHRPSYRSSILSQTDEAKAQPSFANVNISGSYHKGSRTVDITVSGERNKDFVSLEKWTNLTVLLVEDGVIGYQAGADDPNNYSHNGVIRSNVSAVWGDLVEWNGDKYEMHYTATLDEEWNHENMRVVAFLGKPFTGDNFEEIGIVNCEEMHLKDMPVGIYVINIEETVSDVYDLNGRKVRSNAKSLEGLPKGVYIVGGKKIVK